MTRNHGSLKSITGIFALTTGLLSGLLFASLPASAAGGYGSMSMMAPSMKGEGHQESGIVVGGHGEVKVEPDEAVIHLSAVGRAPSALEAQQEMQAKLQRMYDGLARLGYGRDEIRSRNTSLTPRWHWEDGERTLIDYEARTSVEVTVHRLDQMATILQGLVESGIDQISRIDYRATHRQAAYAKALTQAVEEALWKGETIARASGQRISRVLRIEELGAPGPVFRSERAQGMAFAASSTPDIVKLRPGTITVEARVRVVLRAE